MSSDSWAHEYCLGCDRQTDGAAYCSESCRLADFEKTSSTPTSPGFFAPSYPWIRTPSVPSSAAAPKHFYLAPAYDFTKPQAYGGSYPPGPLQRQQAALRSSSTRSLSPCNSHSSLTSIQSLQSTSSANSNHESTQISDKAARELRAYCLAFEHGRYARRKST